MGKKFEITENNKKELLDAIKIHLKSPGPLLPILHSAQKIFKCIPIPVQKIISGILPGFLLIQKKTHSHRPVNLPPGETWGCALYPNRSGTRDLER